MTPVTLTRFGCIAIAVAILSPLATMKADAASKRAAAANNDLPYSQMAPLTAGECKRLGGTVSTDRNCKSGKDCTTFTAGGGVHSVCIDEVEE